MEQAHVDRERLSKRTSSRPGAREPAAPSHHGLSNHADDLRGGKTRARRTSGSKATDRTGTGAAGGSGSGPSRLLRALPASGYLPSLPAASSIGQLSRAMTSEKSVFEQLYGQSFYDYAGEAALLRAHAPSWSGLTAVPTFSAPLPFPAACRRYRPWTGRAAHVRARGSASPGRPGRSVAPSGSGCV